jgi:hypothetical protein
MPQPHGGRHRSAGDSAAPRVGPSRLDDRVERVERGRPHQVRVPDCTERSLPFAAKKLAHRWVGRFACGHVNWRNVRQND